MSTLQSTNLKHESSATNNIVLDASGNTAIQGTLQVGGVATNIYPLVSGTSQASTSGTSIDFTGIPSWVKRITVMLSGVSTNGTSAFLFQLGAGTVQTTGYQSNGIILQGSSTPSGASSTAGFVSSNSVAAADSYHGACYLNLLGSNFWTGNGSLVRFSGTYQTLVFAGGVTLSGTLDRVRITTVNGTDAFDAGSINILYE